MLKVLPRGLHFLDHKDLERYGLPEIDQQKSGLKYR